MSLLTGHIYVIIFIILSLLNKSSVYMCVCVCLYMHVYMHVYVHMYAFDSMTIKYCTHKHVFHYVIMSIVVGLCIYFLYNINLGK